MPSNNSKDPNIKARSPNTSDRANKSKSVENEQPSRLDQLEALLKSDNGASIVDMTNATGWQSHSVRGAMSGALKKRALVITSEKIDGVRRYRAAVSA